MVSEWVASTKVARYTRGPGGEILICSTANGKEIIQIDAHDTILLDLKSLKRHLDMAYFTLPLIIHLHNVHEDYASYNT